MLLKEEMRRVLVYLEYKAKWWEDRAVPWDVLDAETAEGVRAYALRQASIQRALAARFTAIWAAPLAADLDDRRAEENDEGLAETGIWEGGTGGDPSADDGAPDEDAAALEEALEDTDI